MILLIPLVGMLGIMLIGYAGIAFSPFVAATCAVQAQRRGLSVTRYAIAGCIYSLLMLMPALYLIARLFGRRPPLGLVQFVYLVLMLLWATGPLPSAVGILWIELSISEQYNPYRMQKVFLYDGVAVANAVMVLPWLAWWWYRRLEPVPESNLLPHPAFILPFLLVPLGLILFVSMENVEQWLKG